MQIISLVRSDGLTEELRIVPDSDHDRRSLMGFVSLLGALDFAAVSIPGPMTVGVQSFLERHNLSFLPVAECAICQGKVGYDFDHELRAVYLNETCKCRTAQRTNSSWGGFCQQINAFLRDEAKYALMQTAMSEAVWKLFITELQLVR